MSLTISATLATATAASNLSSDTGGHIFYLPEQDLAADLQAATTVISLEASKQSSSGAVSSSMEFEQSRNGDYLIDSSLVLGAPAVKRSVSISGNKYWALNGSVAAADLADSIAAAPRRPVNYLASVITSMSLALSKVTIANGTGSGERLRAELSESPNGQADFLGGAHISAAARAQQCSRPHAYYMKAPQLSAAHPASLLQYYQCSINVTTDTSKLTSIENAAGATAQGKDYKLNDTTTDLTETDTAFVDADASAYKQGSQMGTAPSDGASHAAGLYTMHLRQVEAVFSKAQRAAADAEEAMDRALVTVVYHGRVTAKANIAALQSFEDIQSSSPISAVFVTASASTSQHDGVAEDWSADYALSGVGRLQVSVGTHVLSDITSHDGAEWRKQMYDCGLFQPRSVDVAMHSFCSGANPFVHGPAIAGQHVEQIKVKVTPSKALNAIANASSTDIHFDCYYVTLSTLSVSARAVSALAMVATQNTN